MNKQEVLELINKNPVFYLATTDGDQPRVRGMLLYKADEAGIVFHTGAMRDLCKQVAVNPKAELCFNDYQSQTQIRISGELISDEDTKLKDEIAGHPSRGFLKPWKDSVSLEEFHKEFIVYRLKKGTASKWTMDKNLEPKEYIEL